MDLQRQLEEWRSWQDEQTRAQAAYASSNYYAPAYAATLQQVTGPQPAEYYPTTPEPGTKQAYNQKNSNMGKSYKRKENKQK